MEYLQYIVLVDKLTGIHASLIYPTEKRKLFFILQKLQFLQLYFQNRGISATDNTDGQTNVIHASTLLKTKISFHII